MLWLLCKLGGMLGLLAFTFYRSPWALLPLAPWGIWSFRRELQKLRQRKLEELERQFQECILSVAAGLKAGYSLENAFRESEKDMRAMFGRRSQILGELQELYRGLGNNISLEKLIWDMSLRRGSSYIREFGEILSVAGKTGGNLVEIMGNTARIMQERIAAKAEIDDVLSGKKLEGTIMKGIPFFLIFYVQLDNPGYFDPLYHNIFGVVLMTGCLAVYLFSTYLIEKIMDISLL